MKSRSLLRGSTFGWLLLALVVLAGARPAAGADRRFLVILANPPKTYPDSGGSPPQGFANPATVNSQYFDTNPNNDIYSLSEWWDEISYGSVTVTGETFGWINLPWPIEPPPDPDGEDDATISPANHINLDFDGEYSYGVGEPFIEDQMPFPCVDDHCDGIAIDYNGSSPEAPGLGMPVDAFPMGMMGEDDVADCRCCAPDDDGGPSTCERFSVDEDDDGVLDGCDPGDDNNLPETINPVCPPGTCCLPNSPDEPVQCLTLCDDPATCPPGDILPTECIARGGTIIGMDAEGNPDPMCLRPCGGGGSCSDTRPGGLGMLFGRRHVPSLPLHDRIYTPGERFRDIDEDGRYSALYEPLFDADGDRVCSSDPDDNDYVDIDDDGDRDRPEPFEDFLVRWDPLGFNGQGDWVPVSEEYIRSNYPLNPDWSLDEEIDLLMRSFFSGQSCTLTDFSASNSACLYLKMELYGMRDLGTISPSGAFDVDQDKVDAWTNVDELAWRTGNGIYDPPERFRGSTDPDDEEDPPARLTTKMQQVADEGDPWTQATREPGSGPGLDTVAWYADAWRTRYGTEPPEWAKGFTGRNSPRMAGFDPENPNPNFEGDDRTDEGQRRFFANAGQPDEDETNPEDPADGDVEPDTNVGLYNGWVEHDDLASSRYHAFGDQRLGEVTSPFSDNIYGHDRGPHNMSAGGPDEIIPAAGPLATDIHGDNRLDGGNLLMLEWMTWRTDIPFFDPAVYEATSGLCPAPFRDCNTNGIPDECDVDCGVPGGPCDVPGCGTASDIFPTIGDGIPDICQTNDCDSDGIPNACELTCQAPCDAFQDCGQQQDCDSNGIPDTCELLLRDCNANGTLDDCEGLRGVPDECYTQGLSTVECAKHLGITIGQAWENDRQVIGGYVQLHPYAGPISGLGPDVTGPNGVPDGVPDGFGFRDYNLDGLIDQGEVRPPGSENYIEDGVRGTSNDGTQSIYPWNRRRLMEDCVEILDRSMDFDLWHDVNSPPLPADAAGIVSGIVMLPSESLSNHGLFPFSPSFYPIPTDDRADNSQSQVFRRPGSAAVQLPVFDPTVPNAYYNGLWFHDLVAGIDRYSGNDGWFRYLMFYSAHEYGHAWEGYPDLYDYARLAGDPAETYPIGLWGVMADGDRPSGYPVHPVAHLKDFRSGWIDPVDLTTVLSPGIEQEVTLVDVELPASSNAYYYYQNPLLGGERFYFWRAGFAGLFDVFMPGAGMLIMHTDVGANPDALPAQQQLNPYTWYIVQADGDYELDASLPVGNLGDAGDPWPGFGGTNHPFGNTSWNHFSVPNNRWHGAGFSGIDIMDVIETPTGTRVTYRWTPTEVPVLAFEEPPATMNGEDGRLGFWSYDQYAGTTFTFYYDTDDQGYDGIDIGSTTKATAGILEQGSLDWNLSPQDTALPDGLYYLYAKLIPGVGQDGTESPVSSVRASRNNRGNGNVTDVSVDPSVVKLESWTMTCLDLSGTEWEVEGSESGVQTTNAQTDQLYTTSDGVTFRINAGSIEFIIEDQFTFVTTGFTPYAGPVNIADGIITAVPIARVCDTCAQPLSGDPPLTVEFDGRASDPNGARDLLYEWSFGEDEGTASGAEVSHTYERPGTFVVTLKAIDIDDANRFNTAEVEIRVNNGKPTANIVAVLLSPMNEYPFSIQFFGNESTDPEDLPLTYQWEFTGPLPEHSKTSEEVDPPVQTYFEDPANPGKPYTADVVARLLVTDSAGETDAAEYRFRPGNVAPVARFSVTPISGTVPLTVTVDASATTDGDPGQPKLYSWEFVLGSGFSEPREDAVTASHTYDDTGTYRITLKVSDNIAEGTAQATVVATDLAVEGESPTAAFGTTPDPPEGDAPLSVFFDAGDSSDPQNDELTFDWDFGDTGSSSNTATGVTASHIYETPGTYTAKLTVTDDDPDANQSTPKSVVITVTDPDAVDNLPPTAAFDVVGFDPADGTAPNTVSFSSKSTDPDPDDTLRHEWDFGDASDDDTASGSEVSYTYDAVGSYDVRLTVTDPDGLSDTITKVIEVVLPPNHPPVARVATGPSVFTPPKEVTFDGRTSSDEDGDALTFAWQIMRDGTALYDDITGAQLLVSFRSSQAECDELAGQCLAPGAYTVELTVDDGRGGTDSAGPLEIEVTGGTGGPFGDTGSEAGLATPEERALTGSARVSSGGLCGIGVLMSVLFLGLTMTAWAAGRRRGW